MPTKDNRQTLNRFTRHVLGNKYLFQSARLHPKTKEAKRAYKQDFNLVERVHECESAYLPIPKPVRIKKSVLPEAAEKRKPVKETQDFEPESKLEVTLEPDTFTEEKFKLFEHYQKTVHHEPPSRISRSGFRSFLCDSPLTRTPPISPPDPAQPQPDGSYHQVYRLSGRLVALAVLDLLPNSVSAVYFIYDSSLHTWSPGKLSALRECALARETGRRWYMMGFYIHSCVKMRYKGEFGKQEILNPLWTGDGEEIRRWWDLDAELKARLDVQRYVRFGTPQTETDGADDSTPDSPLDVAGPLHDLGFPGVLDRDQLLALPLARLRIKLSDEAIYEIPWDAAAAIGDPRSAMAIVGDLIAAIGSDLAGKVVIAFG